VMTSLDENPATGYLILDGIFRKDALHFMKIDCLALERPCHV
jgi:hypothetical protein